ncbi:hypothetical protein CODIS_14870 [Candidatus Thiodiazotropha endolucinida]|uniref:Uncharacterized protein n=1 Tax=Candidatus Thiodiazotropha endolucinida TaxID=1655433 RepID=A0A7Z0VML4_9GAMM|nr:hypothetical protein CODIS_14870 [Candidatus Thiodiazotropha endolucinida]
MPHPFIDQKVIILSNAADTEANSVIVGQLKASGLRDVYYVTGCYALDSTALASSRLMPDKVIAMGEVCIERGSVALMLADSRGFHAKLAALARVKDTVSGTVPRSPAAVRRLKEAVGKQP